MRSDYCHIIFISLLKIHLMFILPFIEILSDSTVGDGIAYGRVIFGLLSSLLIA